MGVFDNEDYQSYAYVRPSHEANQGMLNQISTFLRMAGSNPAANMWEAAINNMPKSSEIELPISPIKRSNLEMHRTLPSRSYHFTSEGMKRLQYSSGMTARELTQGQSPTGFYVMSNATLAKEMFKAMGAKASGFAARGGLYNIDIQPTGHQFDVMIGSQHAMDEVISGRLNFVQLGWLASAFTPHQERFVHATPKGGGKIFATPGRTPSVSGRIPINFEHVQAAQLMHEKSLNHITQILSDPFQFGWLVQNPNSKRIAEYHVQGVTSFPMPRMQQSGVQGVISKGADPMVYRALAQFSGSPISRAIYNTFMTSADAAFRKQVRWNGKHFEAKDFVDGKSVKVFIDTNEASKRREAFIRAKWRQFMNPVLEAVQVKTNWAFSPSTTAYAQELLRGSAINPRSGQTLLGVFASNFRQLKAGAKTPRGLSELIGASDIEYVKTRLDQLDTLEREAVDRGAGNPLGQIRNRALAFERLQYQLKPERLAKEFGLKHKWKVQYTFQEQDIISRGYGVWVHIAPEGVDHITPGDPGAIQFFVPFENARGEFTTAGGTRYMGRWLGVSDVVLRRARHARFRKDLSIVSTQLSEFSKYGTFNRTTFGPASLSRVRGGTHIFSATEMIISSFSNRVKALGQYMARYEASGEKGLLSDAQGHMNLAMADATGEVFKAGVAIDKLSTQGHIPVRNSVVLLNSFLGNPYGLASMNRDLVDRESFLNTFRPRLDDDGEEAWDHIHDPTLRAVAKAQWDLVHGDEEELWKLVGSNAIYRNQVEVRDILRAKDDLGLVASGTKAENLGIGVSDRLYSLMPFGTPYARPTQQFGILNDLRRGGSARANTPWLQVEGAEELFGPNSTRYVMTGFITGGKNLATGETMSADEMMGMVGAYEQQMLFNDSLNAEFGHGANLHGSKLMADMSKGIGINGEINGVTWDDITLQLITGVPLEKTVGKHESATTLLRGQLALLMSEAGDNVEYARQRLNTIFSDTGAQFVIDHGSLRAKFGAGHKIFNPYSDPHSTKIRWKMREVGRLAQELNIPLFSTVHIKTAGGGVYEMQVARALLGVRIANDHSWMTSFDARQQLYHGIPGTAMGGGKVWPHMTESARMHQTSIQAIDIQRGMAEGLFMHARNVGMGALAEGPAQRSAYLLNQFATAYEAMTTGKSAGKGVEIGDLAHRLKDYDGTLTTEQWEARYGRGMKSVALPNAVDGMTHLVMPDELPRDIGGGLTGTTTEHAADRVLREISGGDKDAIANAVRNYVGIMGKELSGKEGLFAGVVKNLTISGKGVAKAGLQQSLWASDKTMEPFTARVSSEFARSIGVAGTEHELTDAGGRKFFWANVIRNPNVILGRMGAKVYVDDKLSGLGIYVHESLREALIGDSDGDKVAILVQGMLDSTHFLPSLLAKFHEEAEASWSNKVSDYNKRMASVQRAVGTWYNSGADFMRSLVGSSNKEVIRGATKGGIGAGMKASTAEAIAMQQAVQMAQGMVGSTTDPFQEALLNQYLMPGRSQSDLKNLAELITATGQIREDFLKVKSGNKFDPFEFIRLFRGAQEGQINRDLVPGEELLVPRDGYYKPGTNEFSSFMETQFIKDAREAGKHELVNKYTMFSDFVQGRINKDGAGWFKKFTEDINSPIRGVVGRNVADTSSIIAAWKQLRDIGDLAPVGAIESHVARWKFGQNTSEDIEMARAAAQQMVDTPTAIGPTVAQSLIEEPQEITRGMISPEPGGSARTAAGVTMISENPARKAAGGLAKMMSNPWAIATLAGVGAVGLRALTFQGGNEGRRRPEELRQPDPRPKQKTRVMDASPAGSIGSYDVTVRANSDNDPNNNQLAQGVQASGASGPIQIHLSDSRQKMAEMIHDQLQNKLRGR